MKNIFSRHKRKFAAVGSAMGTAGVMYAVWGAVIALCMMFVVVLHEAGHVFMAQANGIETGYVIFLPLILGILGITQIKNVPKEHQSKVAMAGPVMGVIASCILLVWALFFGLMQYIIPIMLLVLFEVINMFFGSDAKKYKEGKVKV